MEKEILTFRNLLPNSNYLASNTFKSLRTNLMYTENTKVLTVTSAVASEGKSMVGFQLANSFSLIDKRVLLIDCDMRKGSIKRYFNLKGRVYGLSELLTNQTDDIIYPTVNRNLDVIFSGKYPPNPTELLSSKLFSDMIKRCREDYDYIVMDTPPMSVCADATITGRLSDGVVLVVRNDTVSKKVLRNVKTQLLRNGSRILGVVLNRVKKNQVDYQGDKYYDQYYGEEKK